MRRWQERVLMSVDPDCLGFYFRWFVAVFFKGKKKSIFPSFPPPSAHNKMPLTPLDLVCWWGTKKVGQKWRVQMNDFCFIIPINSTLYRTCKNHFVFILNKDLKQECLLSWSLKTSIIHKDSACNAGDLSLIPGLGRSPGEGKGYPLQYSAWRISWTV